MPEITIERLSQLIGSAKANQADLIAEFNMAQKNFLEQRWKYDGAIEVLTLLLDDMRAQTIAETAAKEFDAMTLDDLQSIMPEGVEVEGVTLTDKE